MRDLGIVRPGTTIYVPFATYSSDDPAASMTITGLAATDIEIYKDGSVTQRASDSGYTLLDTDGIDFDGITGIHGVSIDLADNTTAGFYASGSQYTVVISSITLDAGTINFIPVTFRIGYPDAVINTTIATLASQTSFTLTSGPAENDALNGCVVCIHDVASAVQLGFAVISDYVGASKTVTLTAGTTFTAATTDNIAIYPPSNINWIQATAQTANDNGADINTLITNIGTPTDLGSGANISDNLVDIDSAVGNIAIGSAAVSIVAESYTLTTGTQSSGTYTDTETRNGVEHQHTDTAGTTDLYYQFDVGGNGVGTEVSIFGRINGAGDDLTIYAWDWSGAAWDAIGSFAGQGSSTNIERIRSLLSRHTGTGANLGKIRVRFYGTGLTTSTLYVDQIFASYAVISQSVGYSGGQVWINTVSGVAGTESFVNGVADNPVDTLADAITIASNVGLNHFHVSNDSSITFAESHVAEIWEGDGWALSLGGQDISEAHIYHCNDVSGTATCPTGEVHILDSHIANSVACTLGQAHLTNCLIGAGGLVLSQAGDYNIDNCRSGIAGPTAPTIDMGAAVGATNLALRDWRGGITLNNLASGDVVTLDGIFGTITLNGADATVEIRGIAKAVTNNLTGSPTVNDDSIKADDIALILADTGTTLENHLTDIKGTGFVKDTHSLPQCLTATGFSTHAAADVWSVATRVLTAGTNIALAKGVGVTGFNDLSAAQVNAECDTALTDYGALKGGTAMTEGYAADGATATPEQMLYMIWSALSEFAISGTTITAKQLDGSTTAMTFTLDDGTNPTSRTRAT